jgi:hypothetical protein
MISIELLSMWTKYETVAIYQFLVTDFFKLRQLNFKKCDSLTIFTNLET